MAPLKSSAALGAAGSTANAATKDSGDPFWGVPKWALAVAGCVALGVVYYVLSAPPDPKENKKASKTTVKTSSKASTPAKTPANNSSAKSTPSKSVTIEDVEEDTDAITDPLQKAVAMKNKGNKYFKGGRYELAIKCYSDAIQNCPKESKTDLATFYQNRAAAHEQMEKSEDVLDDCNEALKLNTRYLKALERRARIQRKLAKAIDPKEASKEASERLRMALEDITAICILEGFQKQDHLMMVDTILKELGRAEARVIFAERKPLLTSKHFIQQYFMSFDSDPIMTKVREIATEESIVNGDTSAYDRMLLALNDERYEDVLELCEEAVAEESENAVAAKLIRATFYILSKQQKRAMADLNDIIDNTNADPKLRANALIKRASLYIQRCQDAEKDAILSFGDFTKALEIDPENPDVYHHRGQVNLLTDQTSQAIQDFEKAVSLNPKFPIAYVQKLYTEYRSALEKSDQVEVNNVINSFEDAVKKFPDCVETYALFAQILCDQQQFEKADEYYERASKVDQTNANLYVHRALVALQSKGDINGARDLIKKALSIDDKCEFAYETLGTIEVQSGNLKAAVSLFDSAIPLANTELEMGHICGLRSAANAQTTVSERLGVQLPTMMM